MIENAPSDAFSRHTLDLLAAENFDYDASLMGHDIPYLITNGKQDLVEPPSDMSLDDCTQYVSLKDFGNLLPIASPERASEVLRAEFDGAWRHGDDRPDRAHDAQGGVWFARLDEISTHVRKCVAGGWKPRVDRLPFWEAPMKGVIAGKGGVRWD